MAVSIISFGKYLNGEPGVAQEAAAAFGLRLLAGIEEHALNTEHAEGIHFQEQLRALRVAVEADLSPARLEETCGEAIRILKEHERWSRDLNRARAIEVQKMFAMLNQTVAVLSSGSGRSVERLRRIEQEIGGVAQLDDLVALKARLSECLSYVQSESAREHEDMAHTLAAMEAEMEKAREMVAMSRSGLPAREEAEETLARAMEKQSGGFAVLCVLDRFENFSSRYGPAVADQFLALLVEDLERCLPSPKQLFRWSGPSLLALVEPPVPETELREKLRMALQALPLERKLRIGNRMAVIARPVRWSLFGLRKAQSVAVLTEQIRRFTGEEK